MEPNETAKPEKTKAGRPRRLSSVDLDTVQKQLLVVLKRETQRLMDLSFEGKLSQESSKTLINYLKLLKDLDDTKKPAEPETEIPEPENFENLTDDQLKELAAKSQHGG